MNPRREPFALGLVHPLGAARRLELLTYLDHEHQRLVTLSSANAAEKTTALTRAVLTAIHEARHILTTRHF